MNLKNYTSSVPFERSVSQIESLLAKIGVTHIAKSYSPATHQLIGIMFQVEVNGMPLTFKLPAKVEKVEKVMMDSVRKPRIGTKKRIQEQATRTAWKILYDWVYVQISLIQLEQAEITEVFLPYLWSPDRDQTVFAMLKENN